MHETVISSASNSTFRLFLKLLSSRGIRKQNLAIASGARIVAELLRTHTAEIQYVVSSSQHQESALSPPPSAKQVVLTPELFRQLDVCGTHFPLVILRTPECIDGNSAMPNGNCVALAFQDPENVGSVIRSCVAFGVRDILLLEQCAHPLLPKAIRASAGAVFQCRFFDGPRLEDALALPYRGQVVSLSAEGTPLSEFAFSAPTMLVPGIEGEGIPAGWRHRSVAIPMNNGVESLNAAVATSIVLYTMAQCRC